MPEENILVPSSLRNKKKKKKIIFGLMLYAVFACVLATWMFLIKSPFFIVSLGLIIALIPLSISSLNENRKMNELKIFRISKKLWLNIIEHRILLIILIIAAVIRLYGLSFESIWLDEAMTGLRARMNFIEMLDNFASKDHVPFYFTMIWTWGKFFGTSAISIRMPSVIFGVLSVIPIYLIGSGISKRTGYYSALIVAIIPTLVYFSQEARMYSFMLCISAWSLVFLIRFLKSTGRKRKINLALLLTFNFILVYTHYYSLLFIGMECVSVFLMLIIRSNTNIIEKIKSLIQDIWPCVLSILFILPWMVFIRMRYPGTEQTTGGGLKLSNELLLNIYYFLGGFYHLFYNPSLGLKLFISWIMVFLVILGITILVKNSIKNKRIKDEGALLFPLLILPPIMVYIVSVKWQSLYNYRYFLFMSTAFIIFSMIPVAYFSKKASMKNSFSRYLSEIPVLLICVLLLVSSYNMIVMEDKDDWRGAVQYINENQGDNDLVIPQPAHYRYAIFYHTDELIVRSISDSSKNVSELFDQYSTIWVITFHYRDIDGYGFTQYLENWSYEDYNHFNGVNMRKYWI